MDPCTGQKRVFQASDGRTAGRTDGQPENIMPPAPKGGGITIKGIHATVVNCDFTRPNLSLEDIRDIKNNAWVTVNNDFSVTSGVICQWFSRVTSSLVKIIGKTPLEWPKIVIHGNECIILFLTRYFISWTYRSATNNHWSPISPLSPGTVFSDLTLWRHHSWSVTSCEREALALWRNIQRLF